MKLNNIVKEIIENNKISKQTEITDILSKKYKKDVTQSNISRILKQIKAVKVVDENKKVIYEIQQKLNETSSWIKKIVKKIDDNGQSVLIKTYPGAAGIVGQAIDEKSIENIMGTISGDDAVLVIPKEISKIGTLRKDLEGFLL